MSASSSRARSRARRHVTHTRGRSGHYRRTRHTRRHHSRRSTTLWVAFWIILFVVAMATDMITVTGS